MFRTVFRLALRFLRLAGETFFCFELNRFLGRAVRGPIRYRRRALSVAEADLLHHVRAPVQTKYVQLPNGLHLYTIIAGRKAGPASTGHADDQADDNPIVLLHGHSMGGATFFRNFDDLLDMGYSTVYALDLPGWARSSRPRFCKRQGRTPGQGQSRDRDYPVEFFLAPFRQWVRAVGLKRFALMGHSLGAYLAHEFVLRAHPLTVSQLILAAPAAVTRCTPLVQALWFALTPQTFLTRGGLLSLLIFGSKYPSTPAYNMRGFRRFTLFANSIAHRSGDAAAAGVLQFSRCGIFRWRSECIRPIVERVAKLPCPIHVVVGERDQLIESECFEVLYREMENVGNRVTFSVIAGADHSPHIVAPFAFAKALMRGDASLAGSFADGQESCFVGRHQQSNLLDGGSARCEVQKRGVMM